MKILFIHQNFPAQFKHLAPKLVEQDHEVWALVLKEHSPELWRGVKLITYQPKTGSSPKIHPWVVDLETKIIRGEAAFHAAWKLKQQGFEPDLIIAHPGWGESLFIKNVWPQSRLAMYCEFFYRSHGLDTNFDPEFSTQTIDDNCRIQIRNLNNLLHFEIADAGISPTQWQASTFPESFRQKITVIHDGIDTELAKPNPNVSLTLNHQLTLTRDNEIITFVNRNLEPYRGYHIFMRCLPELLRRRPQARILLIGGDQVSYGARPKKGQSWKQIFLDEIKPQLSEQQLSRIHFLGNVSYEHFLWVLQLSTIHVYLTYPFVLSWSLLEAMSIGCTIVASDTPPLHEVIQPNYNGQLVNFFDHSAWVEQICELLNQPKQRQQLSINARQFVQQNYDLKCHCLPKQLEWVNQLLSH